MLKCLVSMKPKDGEHIVYVGSPDGQLSVVGSVENLLLRDTQPFLWDSGALLVTGTVRAVWGLSLLREVSNDELQALAVGRAWPLLGRGEPKIAVVVYGLKHPWVLFQGGLVYLPDVEAVLP